MEDTSLPINFVKYKTFGQKVELYGINPLVKAYLNDRFYNNYTHRLTESRLETEVEEKVQNNNVELESFTDVYIDERKEPEVTESKY